VPGGSQMAAVDAGGGIARVDVPPMKRIFPASLHGFLLMGMLWGGGCATAPRSKPGAAVVKPPFEYESLRVRNACFVESVHVYDLYKSKRLGGPEGWARILEWGNQEGDFSISKGHAVALFSAGEKMWIYDINHGFVRLKVPVERRADLTDVTPEVFAKYSAYRPVMARYREDYPQLPQEKRPEFLFYHANPDVREATRVASELGRFRPVRVVEFNFTKDGQPHASAAAVFIFGARVCIYFPRGGTHISNPTVRSVDNMAWITYVIQRVYPGAQDVRLQPGGYLLFPPKG
jgi:hypothetical protein